MKWQTADFNKLFILQTPTFLRNDVNNAFVKTLLSPIVEIYKDTLYKMQHTCQVIYLEKVLNEWFNVSGYNSQNHAATKTVYITDSPAVPRKYIYRTAENHPLYLGTVYLGNPAAVNYKFIINIPSSYTFVEAQLRAIVDYYKLAGKKYIIVTYDL